LDLLSPVDDVGKFTIEAGERFVGMSVLGEGNQAIIDALMEVNSLLKAEDYPHKYTRTTGEPKSLPFSVPPTSGL
jgi:isoleucyl-tRNA synthetase